MKPLTRPSIDPELVLSATVSRIQSAALRARFDESTADLLTGTRTFEQAASSGQLSALGESDFPRGTLSYEDLKDHYDQRFARQGSPGREYYDHLMLAPRHGRCPYCGVGVVSTLDHYLPKKKFSGISVLPDNLIPACRDCNYEKREYTPSQTKPAIIHPYFDNFESYGWLRATIIEGEPPGAVFDVSDSIPALVRDRLRTHLDVLGLRQRFASHAGERIVELDRQLLRVFQGGGAVSVSDHLAEEADIRSREYGNGWETSLLHALAANTWYCEIYFAASQQVAG